MKFTHKLFSAVLSASLLISIPASAGLVDVIYSQKPLVQTLKDAHKNATQQEQSEWETEYNSVLGNAEKHEKANTPLSEYVKGMRRFQVKAKKEANFNGHVEAIRAYRNKIKAKKKREEFLKKESFATRMAVKTVDAASNTINWINNNQGKLYTAATVAVVAGVGYKYGFKNSAKTLWNGTKNGVSYVYGCVKAPVETTKGAYNKTKNGLSWARSFVSSVSMPSFLSKKAPKAVAKTTKEVANGKISMTKAKFLELMKKAKGNK